MIKTSFHSIFLLFVFFYAFTESSKCPTLDPPWSSIPKPFIDDETNPLISDLIDTNCCSKCLFMGERDATPCVITTGMAWCRQFTNGNPGYGNDLFLDGPVHKSVPIFARDRTAVCFDKDVSNDIMRKAFLNWRIYAPDATSAAKGTAVSRTWGTWKGHPIPGYCDWNNPLAYDTRIYDETYMPYEKDWKPDDIKDYPVADTISMPQLRSHFFHYNYAPDLGVFAAIFSAFYSPSGGGYIADTAVIPSNKVGIMLQAGTNRPRLVAVDWHYGDDTWSTANEYLADINTYRLHMDHGDFVDFFYAKQVLEWFSLATCAPWDQFQNSALGNWRLCASENFAYAGNTLSSRVVHPLDPEVADKIYKYPVDIWCASPRIQDAECCDQASTSCWEVLDDRAKIGQNHGCVGYGYCPSGNGQADSYSTFPCSRRGKCTYGGRCFCDPGWAGPACEFNTTVFAAQNYKFNCSEYNPCSDKGYCIDDINGQASCKCHEGWIGKN